MSGSITISGNRSSSLYNVDTYKIFVLSGTASLVMYGGVTLMNSAGYAVDVGSGCSFTMHGGAVRDGTEIGVYNAGTFTMNDGTIYNNVMIDRLAGSNSRAGAGVYNTGTFTLNNGTISENKSRGGDGGGVINTGTFTMNNGTISYNTARRSDGALWNGGGVLNAGGTFTMYGGSISYNRYSSTEQGFNVGGGLLNSSGYAYLYGGSINYNRASTGGATSGSNIARNGTTFTGNSPSN
jgi:hypothetical protein